MRGIARKKDVSLTPTTQPKRATGALESVFAAAGRARRMLAHFEHCLLVSRVESPHIACSLSGDLRSVTVPRVASRTSVRDRRELTIKAQPARSPNGVPTETSTASCRQMTRRDQVRTVAPAWTWVASYLSQPISSPTRRRGECRRSRMLTWTLHVGRCHLHVGPPART